MRAVVQRVSSASVTVEDETVGRIGQGLVVLLAVGRGDDAQAAVWLSEKIAHLRIFEDDDGKMNRSVLDVGGQVLVISQFTLFGDCRKGRRPSYLQAADPAPARDMYRQFAAALCKWGLAVETGRFGAKMTVALVNDGPVTLIVESP
jgi:D-tyrosyl-tRNA(Tyr) deacylase